MFVTAIDALVIKAAVQQPDRNEGRRMVVARSNCSRMAVESKSNRSCTHRLTRLRTGRNMPCMGLSKQVGLLVVQVIKMLMTVVALFAFCWLPLQTYNLLSEIYPQINM